VQIKNGIKDKNCVQNYKWGIKSQKASENKKWRSESEIAYKIKIDVQIPKSGPKSKNGVQGNRNIAPTCSNQTTTSKQLGPGRAAGRQPTALAQTITCS
jgi:hypothetical protein